LLKLIVPGRWLKAMGGPTPFKAKASEIQKIIVEVRYMSEELLNKNVDNIKKLTISQSLLASKGAYTDAFDVGQLQEIDGLNKNVNTIKKINIGQFLPVSNAAYIDLLGHRSAERN
jgi:CTP:phosphocholine cytidylyltransferase-like protein